MKDDPIRYYRSACSGDKIDDKTEDETIWFNDSAYFPLDGCVNWQYQMIRDADTGQGMEYLDLGYTLFKNLNVKLISFEGTSFYHSVFIDCVFSHVNFSKCDFRGAQFVQCVFRGEQTIFFDVKTDNNTVFGPNISAEHVNTWQMISNPTDVLKILHARGLRHLNRFK